MEDEEFNVTMLAEKTEWTKTVVPAKVKLLTGMTPVAYIRKLRMKKQQCYSGRKSLPSQR